MHQIASKSYRKRNLSIIVNNQFLTALADSIYDVAIFWYVYDQSESALLASVITALSFLTQIVIGPFIGVLADRSNPKKIMHLGFLLMILVGISMAVFYYYILDCFIILLYIGVILHDVGMSTIRPAKSKLLPQIIDMDRIVQVNGYISSVTQIAILLGKSISGFLIAIIGFVGVMLFHSVAYLIAALVLNFLVIILITPKSSNTELAAAIEDKVKKSYIQDLKDAFHLMRSNRPLFKIIIIGMVLNIASVIGPLFVVIVTEQYNAGAIIFGWFNAIAALSGVLVGIFAKQLVNLVKPYRMFGFSIGIAGITMILVGTLTNVFAGMAIYFIMSFSLTLFNIAFSSLLITLVEDEYRGRVNNLTIAIAAIMIPGISIFGGYLADVTSASLVYILAGSWVLIWGPIIFLDKDIRTLKKI